VWKGCGRLFVLCREDIANKDLLDIFRLKPGTLDGSWRRELAGASYRNWKMVVFLTLYGMRAQLNGSQTRKRTVVVVSAGQCPARS
jgi:hypothetical protein